MNEDSQEQRPIKLNLYTCLKRVTHLKCLLLTLLITGCISTIIWCTCTRITRLIFYFQSFPIKYTQSISPCDQAYLYIPIFFVLILYIIYLLECWNCSTRTELIYGTNLRNIENYIQQLRTAKPVIWWKAICYHYMRRTREITRYRNGDSYVTTQIYYERINTHISGSYFQYNHLGVKDISKNLIDLDKHSSTKIKFSKGFAFACLEAANEYENQRTRFFQESERHDDYVEMKEGLDLLGCNFQEYMVGFLDKNKLPWYISHCAFWLFSLFLLSWPFRILIELKTAHVHYQITKLFGSNYLSTENEINQDSLDIISNCTIAPSYSEALLYSGPQPPIKYDTNLVLTESLPLLRYNSHRSNSNSNGNAIILKRSSFPILAKNTFYSIVARSMNTIDNSNNNSNNNDNNNLTNLFLSSPPMYEEAVFCLPLRPLTRSITDRDFIKKLNDYLRKPWSSIADIRKCKETQV